MNRCGALLAGVVFSLFTAAVPGFATTFTVNSTADAVDANLADGVCETATPGVCTLRAAIQQANASAGADTIVLPAGTYTLTLAGANENAAVSGDLDVTGTLTITGAGAATTIIQACTVDQKTANCSPGQGVGDRIFDIQAGANVTISGVTIRHGNGATGGGISNQGTLNLTDSVVSDNTSGPNNGGGLSNSIGGTATLTRTTVTGNIGSLGGGVKNDGTLTLINSAVSDNPGGQGGGIHNGGTVTITDSTITGNGPAGSGGGGIQNQFGSMTVTGSTVSGNTASSFGGGIENFATLTLTNSTVSGNGVTGDGGGIFNGGSLTLNNTTVTDNTASGLGGGLRVTSGTVALRNTIVAANFDTSSAQFQPDCSGTVTSQGFNLIGNGAGCTGVTDGVNGDQVGTTASPIDPQLTPLADNGGPTLTHGLLISSPAIDAGNPTGCTDATGNPLTTDQRGFPRPVGAACDIGAFEGTIFGPLDHFHCYKTKSTKGDLCTEDALLNPGGSCEAEEDCGGNSDDDLGEVTSFCVPNKFPRGLRVSLSDQLEPDSRVFDVKKPATLCAPADKNREGITDSDTHLQGYQIVLTKGQCAAGAPSHVGAGCVRETDCGGTQGVTSFCVPQPKSVKQLGLQVTNQFHASGSPLVLDTNKPDRLLVPAAKSFTAIPDLPGPNGVDHFKCYTVKVSKGTPKFTPILGVLVEDQFTSGPRAFDLKKPTRLCTPADKNGEGIKNATAHLLCYQAKASKGLCAAGAPANEGAACAKEADCGGVKGQTSFCVLQPKFQKVTGIFVNNQLDSGEVDTQREDEFCVPSEKN